MDDNDQILFPGTNENNLSRRNLREERVTKRADEELPRAIIVTNVNLLVFENQAMKVFTSKK